MNRARSPRIDESVTEPVIGAELREPAAPPDPMRKKRVGPASQDRGGGATRPKPPAIRAAPQRDQRSQTHAENLQQRGQRCGRTIERHCAEKKWLRGNPIPTFSRQSEDVTRQPDEPLPGKSTNEIHDSRDRQAGYRRHHHVTRAARAPQTGIDERDSGGRKRDEKNEEQTGNHCCFRESWNRRGHYLLSSRRMTIVSPKASTATPARTNTPREGADARSTIAARTSSQPASNNKKPTNFILNAPGRGLRVFPGVRIAS